jgi:hypothetical protein
MTTADNIPWKLLATNLGDVPFYVIQFDKHGNCTSPSALDHLVEMSKIKTDVFLFSHGWNNDWDAATRRYDRFVQRFVDVRGRQWNPPSRPFTPVMVGVFWPSTALVAPWERAPDIATGGLSDPDIAALADVLEPDEKAKFFQIVSEPSGDGATKLAEMLVPVVAGHSDETDEIGSGGGPVSVDDLLAVWRAVADQRPAESVRPRGGFIDDDSPAAGSVIAEPALAGWNPVDLIRDGIRATTVLLMKDRAGRVGGTGVAQMLHRLIEASEARVSLAGHSYGAKVVLSALCGARAMSRKVDSALLLQPALSCYAFTASLEGKPGGYRPALDLVRLPIITTYSRHDEPLTKFFHLAVRRKSDLAEVVIAAPGQPPSKFSALGGYGPWGVDVDADWITMPAVAEPYPPSIGRRVVAVDGTQYISSHGAVETPETAWALLSQVRG